MIPITKSNGLVLYLEVSQEGTLHFHVEGQITKLSRSTWKELKDAFQTTLSLLKDKGYTEAFTWVPSNNTTIHKLQRRVGFTALYAYNGNTLSRVEL